MSLLYSLPVTSSPTLPQSAEAGNASGQDRLVGHLVVSGRVIRSRDEPPLMSFGFPQLTGWSIWFVCFLLVWATLTGSALAQNLASDPQVDAGTHPYGSYDGIHDSVSVMSGNMSFCLPLIDLPGISNHDLTIPLCYNSQFTQQVSNGQGQYPATPVVSYFPWVWGSSTPHLGPGWTLLGRPLTYVGAGGYPVIYMPNGTIYPHNVSSLGYWGIVPNSPNIQWGGGWIYQADGTRSTDIYTSGNTGPVTTTQVYDKDNTLITFTSNSITDTVGRTVSVSAANASQGSPANITFQYPDSAGVLRSVVVEVTSQTFSCTGNSSGMTSPGGPWAMPTAILLPNGLTYTFQYDSCGELSKVTYPSGGYTRYVYTGIETTQEPASGTGGLTGWIQAELIARYVCSAPAVTLGATSTGAGNTCPLAEELTTYSPTAVSTQPNNSSNTVTDPVGNQVVYQFSNESTLTQNFLSYETSRQYKDPSGKVLKTIQTAYYPPSAAPTLIPVVPSSETTILDNGLESQIQWSYDFRSNWDFDSPMIEKREYDYGQGSPGALLRRTDYDWWQLDNPSQFGGAGTAQYTQPLVHILDHKTSEIVYDGNGNTVSQIKYQYDGGGAPNASSRGDLTSVSEWRNTDGAWLTTTNTWGAGGIASTKDPNGNTTLFDYTDNYADGVNRNSNAFVTTITHPSTNGVAHVEHKAYYWGSGLVAASCGQNFTGTCKPGLTSASDYASYAYDLLGRRILTSTGDGGSSSTCFSDVVGSNCYNGAYPLEITSAQRVGNLYKTSTAILDGLARIAQTQLNSDPSCPTGPVNTDTVYDLDERVSSVSNPYCSTSDPTYGSTIATYDGLGRVIKSTHQPDGTYTSSTFTGRAVLSSDEGNGTRTVQRVSQTDALGRLAYVCEVTAASQLGTSGVPSSCGLDVAAVGLLTSYSYDLLGDLTSVTQGGETRTFVYDSLSRLSSATNPESGTTSYVYDLNGNLSSKKDAKPVTTTYVYDALNRLTGKSYNDGTTPSACFQYDQTGTNTTGRLVTEWTQLGVCPAAPSSNILTKRTIAAYDNMGRVSSDNQCAPPNNCSIASPYTFNYGYDFSGNVTSFNNALSGASALTYTAQYDAADRLCWLGNQAENGSCSNVGMFAATYNPAGGLANANLGSGISMHRDYNPRLFPVDETDTVGTAPGTATVQIGGAEQLWAYSTGSITFIGNEQSMPSGGQTAYDSGLFLVSINGASPYQITYGQYDTAQTLASALAGAISCASGPVKAAVSGSTVNLLSCAEGNNTSYSISAIPDGHTTGFAQYSFSVVTSSSTMTKQPAATPPPAPYTPSTAAVPLGTIYIGGNAISGQSGSTEVFVQVQGSGPFIYKAVPWNSSSTAASMAQALATSFAPCSTAGTIITANLIGTNVALSACNSGTTYLESVGSASYSPGSSPAFYVSTAPIPASAPGNPLPVPANGVYDSGTVNLTVDGTQIASVPFSSSSTPASVAAALAAAGSNNTIATLTANGAGLTMTTKGDGAVDDFAYALSATYDTTHFTQPSFASTPGSGSLAGGQNVPLYSWSIPAGGGYAPNGNILSVTDSVMGTWSYRYDDMNRIITGSASAGHDSGLNLAWTYDRYGNRWTQGATGTGVASQVPLTFNGNSNRADNWLYDPAGNLKNDGVNSYTYDAENRLLTVNGTPTYAYDAEGRRVAKYNSSGAVIASYLLGLNGEQVTELNGSGAWAHSNVYAGGQLLATYSASNSAYHYHMADWLGTNRLQTTASGNQEETCYSNPFGDGLSCTGVADAAEQHFTGKERDTESGLDYFGARYYSSALGRFMTPDWASAPTAVPYAQFGNPQSLNLYSYVGNNPVMGRDADGHCGEPGDESETCPPADPYAEVEYGQGIMGEELSAGQLIGTFEPFFGEPPDYSLAAPPSRRCFGPHCGKKPPSIEGIEGDNDGIDPLFFGLFIAGIRPPNLTPCVRLGIGCPVAPSKPKPPCNGCTPMKNPPTIVCSEGGCYDLDAPLPKCSDFLSRAKNLAGAGTLTKAASPLTGPIAPEVGSGGVFLGALGALYYFAGTNGFGCTP